MSAVSTITGKYTAEQLIEYTSFAESGYSLGVVDLYAPAGQQTQTCPNCEQLAVPRPWPGPADGGLQECPRCLAWCRFGPLTDPLIDIRVVDPHARKGTSNMIRIRESQLRPVQRVTAHITPEVWRDERAIPVDAPGPQEWDCTWFARRHYDYVLSLAGDLTVGVIDNDDLFQEDPAAPKWVRVWCGPFTITIRQEQR